MQREPLADDPLDRLARRQRAERILKDHLHIRAQSGLFTVTSSGNAGQEIDAGGYSHIWSYLHKGLNTSLTIAKRRKLSFPDTFATSETHVYPDPQTGNMVLSESTSAYTFLSSNTQAANNNGQTMADLVNTLTNSLVRQGYKQP